MNDMFGKQLSIGDKVIFYTMEKKSSYNSISKVVFGLGTVIDKTKCFIIIKTADEKIIKKQEDKLIKYDWCNPVKEEF